MEVFYFNDNEHESLIDMIRLMAHDTGVSIDEFETWITPEDVELLESQSRRIPEDERLTFVAGDEEDIARITSTYEIYELHDYLNDIFTSDFSILEGE